MRQHRIAIAWGLVWASTAALTYAGELETRSSVETREGFEVWSVPSDEMIKMGCQYQYRFDEGSHGQDMMHTMSNAWHTHGKAAVNNEQTGKGTARFSNYTILMKNCCGIGNEPVEVGGLTVQYDQVSGRLWFAQVQVGGEFPVHGISLSTSANMLTKVLHVQHAVTDSGGCASSGPAGS